MYYRWPLRSSLGDLGGRWLYGYVPSKIHLEPTDRAFFEGKHVVFFLC